MKIDIRMISEVNADEISEIAAIEADNFGVGGLNQWHLPIMIRYGKVFVIRANGVMAGAAELIADWRQPERVFIIGFSISKQFQGQGFGSRLLRAVVDYLKEDGRVFLLLTAAVDNRLALKLYAKFGFKEIDKLADEYGKGMDRVLLRLDLDGASHE